MTGKASALQIIRDTYVSEVVPPEATVRTFPDDYHTAVLTIGDHRLFLGTDEDGDYLWTVEERPTDPADPNVDPFYPSDSRWELMDQDGTGDEDVARAHVTRWARAVGERRRA